MLRRLRALPAPAADVAQDLVDATFLELDRALREMGVGDVAVPKRIKALAEAFYGRAESYDRALDSAGDEALAATLGRNVLGGDIEPGPLAAYVRNAERHLARNDLGGIFSRRTLFPDPSRFMGEA